MTILGRASAVARSGAFAVAVAQIGQTAVDGAVPSELRCELVNTASSAAQDGVVRFRIVQTPDFSFHWLRKIAMSVPGIL